MDIITCFQASSNLLRCWFFQMKVNWGFFGSLAINGSRIDLTFQICKYFFNHNMDRLNEVKFSPKPEVRCVVLVGEITYFVV